MNLLTVGGTFRHFQRITFCHCSQMSWPLDKVGEVPFGLDFLCDANILRPFLKQRIYHLLGLLLLHDSRAWGHPLPLSLLSFWNLGGWRREQTCLLCMWELLHTFPERQCTKAEVDPFNNVSGMRKHRS